MASGLDEAREMMVHVSWRITNHVPTSPECDAHLGIKSLFKIKKTEIGIYLNSYFCKMNPSLPRKKLLSEGLQFLRSFHTQHLFVFGDNNSMMTLTHDVFTHSTKHLFKKYFFYD